jgi:hypothetical protein
MRTRKSFEQPIAWPTHASAGKRPRHWGHAIAADVALLRKAGYNLPMMDEIKRGFAPKA